VVDSEIIDWMLVLFAFGNLLIFFSFLQFGVLEVSNAVIVAILLGWVLDRRMSRKYQKGDDDGQF